MRLLQSFTLVFAAIFVFGCQGGDHEGVTGTISLDGQPLPKARVVFTPTGKGRPASATTDEAGKYDLIYSRDKKGAPAGEYLVRIRTGGTQEGEDGRDIEIPEKVPDKYNGRSDLIVVVKEGEANTFDFDLLSE